VSVVVATVTDAASSVAVGTFPLTIAPAPLLISTATLPAGVAGTAYSATLAATGGVIPYTWTAAGLPSAVAASASGVLSGVPASPGSSTVTVTVTDSKGATATARFTLTVAPAPLAIVTASLPDGRVQSAYSVTLAATGGTGSNKWSATGLPAGLAMSADSTISGTPTADGAFTVAVTVTDAAGSQAKQTYTLTIAPAPLVVSTATLPAGVAGTAYSATLAATGGVIPYTWTVLGLPSGVAASAGGVLSGTPALPGSYAVTATVTDSKGAAATARFTLTLAAAPLAIATTSLPDGRVQSAYSATLAATGGVTPYTWTVLGLPAGIAASAGGLLSGTPAPAGAYAVTATVTDSKGATATARFTLTVAPAPLAIATASLPDGRVQSAYSATLAATGGVTPYTWTVLGLPSGIAASTGGALSGTPASAGSYTVTATVTDSKSATATARFTLTVAPAPIAIAIVSLPNGTVQSAYSVTLAVTGGAGSNKWSATGLPAGLAMSAAGTISGAPTAPGVSVVVVTVTDAAGGVAVGTFALTIVLPATPPLNFSSLPSAANPGTQSGVQVGVASAYPLPVAVTLTLVFTPDSGADDPAVQFSTGGRSAVIQIPAGVTTLVGNASLQTGTVAGTIVITAQLSAAGQDITPSPAPQQTMRIAVAAPVVSSVTAVRNSTGFTVTAIGFATPRQVTQANFQFAAASSANLQTSSLAIPVTSLFSAWYASAAAAPYGSQFSFVQPFTVTGNMLAVTSVTVTLTNAQGTSTAVTANLQ
jgi:hypothetical protein